MIFWLLEKFTGINEFLFQSNMLPKPAALMLLSVVCDVFSLFCFP
jgi:hypothetical protein